MTTIRWAPPAAWRTVYYDPRIQIRPDQSFIRTTPQQVVEARKINAEIGQRVVDIRHKTKQVPL